MDSPEQVPYAFGSDRDLRNVILLLVKAHKMRHSHATSLQSLLTGLMMQSRSSIPISPKDFEDQARDLPKIQATMDQIADDEARQLETILKGDGPFLDALRVYASRQFWQPRPSGCLP
jgi:hypothetical protein